MTPQRSQRAFSFSKERWIVLLSKDQLLSSLPSLFPYRRPAASCRRGSSARTAWRRPLESRSSTSRYGRGKHTIIMLEEQHFFSFLYATVHNTEKFAIFFLYCLLTMIYTGAPGERGGERVRVPPGGAGGGPPEDPQQLPAGESRAFRKRD
jgi:hypothetical protein